VEAVEEVWGEVVDAVDEVGGAGVGGAGGTFFLVGEGHGAEGENFVDFGGVEQGSRAFVGDGRVVVEDDWGAEDGGRVANEDRPGAFVDAFRGDPPRPLRRVEQ
jgi:hypothetical protein